MTQHEQQAAPIGFIGRNDLIFLQGVMDLPGVAPRQIEVATYSFPGKFDAPIYARPYSSPQPHQVRPSLTASEQKQVDQCLATIIHNTRCTTFHEAITAIGQIIPKMAEYDELWMRIQTELLKAINK